MEEIEKKELTEQEIRFCELYAFGEAPYGGNASCCYKKVFNDTSAEAKGRALRMIARPEIQEFLKDLEAVEAEESKHIKTFLKENLMCIIQNCTTAEYRDRRGTLLSPAPLRSVAVAASKALMELYPVREAQRLSIESDGENGGITFNVVVPGMQSIQDSNSED